MRKCFFVLKRPLRISLLLSNSWADGIRNGSSGPLSLILVRFVLFGVNISWTAPLSDSTGCYRLLACEKPIFFLFQGSSNANPSSHRVGIANRNVDRS